MSTQNYLFSTKKILALLALALLIILLGFPNAALSGAKSGLLLWFNVVTPTLLPFIIVSNLIINLNLTRYIAKICYPIFHFIYRISPTACYPALIGMLSGLPVGAKACADLVKKGSISTSEGQYLLTFCNNASPMFIISFVGISTLGLPTRNYIFLLIIYLSAYVTSVIYRLFMPPIYVKNKVHPLHARNIDSPKKISFTALDQAIIDGFDVITKVGGYIIIFSILTQFIIDAVNNTKLHTLLAIGTLEITNGINMIGSATNLNMAIKITLILTIMAFGGCSSIAQTKSVIDGSGLSIKNYTLFKIVNALICSILTLGYLWVFPV
ncbi:membrane protein [Lachnospiraceae bacterium KM106-2]|nr:membrane protein [Lachnospiraceae bacterium KM106-2]